MSELAPEGAPVELPPEQEDVGWQAPSQEEWQATQDRLAQVEQVLAPQPTYQPQPQGPPIPDPFTETYAQDLQAYTQAQLAPIQQFIEQQQMERGEQQAMEMLGEIGARDGEFDKDMAWVIARDLAATRGVPSNDRESQHPRTEAAKQVREYERRVGEAYHQQQIEQIQTVAGAPRGLPAQVNGAQTVPAGGYGNVPGAVERRFFGGN
jgi:hypothetical protein